MEQLRTRLSELDIPLTFDADTSGKGNCFFAAICQQMRRTELGLTNLYNPATLRKCVCEFALMLTGPDPRVVEKADQFDKAALMFKRRPWIPYFHDMKKNGVYAEEPVVFCLAWLLGRDVVVVSEQCTLEKPWDFISASHGSYPPILLGNVQGIYFQSLLPKENFSQYFSSVINSVPTVVSTTAPIVVDPTASLCTTSSIASDCTAEFTTIAITSDPSAAVSTTTSIIVSEAVSPISVVVPFIPSTVESSSTNPLKRSCELSPNDGPSKKLATPTLMDVDEVKSLGKSIFRDISTILAENRKLHATVSRQVCELKARDVKLKEWEQSVPDGDLDGLKIKGEELAVKEESLKRKEEGLKMKEEDIRQQQDALNTQLEELKCMKEEAKTTERYLKETVEELKMTEVELKTTELDMQKLDLATKKRELELKKREEEFNKKEERREEELKKREEQLTKREEEIRNEQFNSFMGDAAVDSSFFDIEM